ncbi:MAG: hydrogen peroxide-inducible genes activator [Burkholderiales bacterium]|nr:hydrogen peroxide-inducible genes activator [Burkholderiales bacterium]
MTLTELRYIVALAHEKHFGRAAEACHVAQPTLSVAVKKFEDELGVLLFERGKNEVAVTPVGERIVAQARQVLDELEGVKRIARQARDPLDGLLRIGAIFTVGPYLFPRLVPVLHASAPHMPLVIEENYTERLRERLVQGELDAIIACLPFEAPGVVTLPLYDEPFVAMAPRAHPWRARDTVSTDEFAPQTVLLLGAGHCFRDQVVAACPSCVRPGPAAGGRQRAVEGSSLETIRQMVASGMGVTMLPCTAAGSDQSASDLTVIRAFVDPPQRRVALAWRASFPRPQAIEALRQAIRACALDCVSYLSGPSGR